MNTLVMKNNNVTIKWRYFDDEELASYEDEDTITIIAKFEDKGLVPMALVGEDDLP